jgi:3'-phosphoadenosine 5'-phosphosulfate sulfotransferase (PAPS reductase)/FAD synthetase
VAINETHIVLFSGGIASWAAAKRVVALHGAQNTKLLFTDTKTEDEDLYRFLVDASKNVGAELVTIADGRDVWQVFKDVGYMGNSRKDPCSKILKRLLADKWIKDRYKPDECIVHIGITWDEIHRFDRLKERKKPYQYLAPMCDAPYLTKEQIFQWAEQEGLKRPRLYDSGFQHNNCGGFCIRAGQAHYYLLHKAHPELYAEYERKEQEVYQAIGKRHPFLRVTIDGVLNYISLKEFREQYIGTSKQCDLFDWGGCGCFSEDEA